MLKFHSQFKISDHFEQADSSIICITFSQNCYHNTCEQECGNKNFDVLAHFQETNIDNLTVSNTLPESWLKVTGKSPKIFPINTGFSSRKCIASYSLTLRQDSANVSNKNKKPEPASSGRKSAMKGRYVMPPIISAFELHASANIFARNGESVMSNMSNGFIKLQRAALELLQNDHKAFLLISLIALRTRWGDVKYDKCKLQVGQAFIGDYKSIGLTEQEYREAKYRLEFEYKLLTCSGTNRGTVVTLLNTDIYDVIVKTEQRTDNGLNNGLNNGQKKRKTTDRKKEKERAEQRADLSPKIEEKERAEQRTEFLENNGQIFAETTGQTTGSTTTKEEEDIYEKEKREREEKRKVDSQAHRRDSQAHRRSSQASRSSRSFELKMTFGEHGNVRLTPSEMDKLLRDHGTVDTEWMIAKLDIAIPNAKRPYRSHYHTMCPKGWVHNALLEHKEKQSSGKVLTKSSISVLLPRLEGRYAYQINFSNVEIITSAGYPAAKFHVSDIKGFERWLKDKNL